MAGSPLRAAEEPLRVRVVDRLLRLAQVEAADDPDLPRVRLAQHVAEEIAAGRQERARIVERRARRVLRDDAAHVDEEGIGAGVVDGGDERRRIDDGVALGEIGLEEPDRLGQPPARRRGHLRGQGRRRQHGKGRERGRASACTHVTPTIADPRGSSSVGRNSIRPGGPPAGPAGSQGSLSTWPGLILSGSVSWSLLASKIFM